jgi:hypothetical protein
MEAPTGTTHWHGVSFEQRACTGLPQRSIQASLYLPSAFLRDCFIFFSMACTFFSIF